MKKIAIALLMICSPCVHAQSHQQKEMDRVMKTVSKVDVGNLTLSQIKKLQPYPKASIVAEASLICRKSGMFKESSSRNYYSLPQVSKRISGSVYGTRKSYSSQEYNEKVANIIFQNQSYREDAIQLYNLCSIIAAGDNKAKWDDLSVILRTKEQGEARLDKIRKDREKKQAEKNNKIAKLKDEISSLETKQEVLVRDLKNVRKERDETTKPERWFSMHTFTVFQKYKNGIIAARDEYGREVALVDDSIKSKGVYRRTVITGDAIKYTGDDGFEHEIKTFISAPNAEKQYQDKLSVSDWKQVDIKYEKLSEKLRELNSKIAEKKRELNKLS